MSRHLSNKYAIVGLGVTPLGKTGHSSDMLAAQAIRLAADDAGLSVDDLDGFITHNAGMHGFGRATGDVPRRAGMRNAKMIWSMYAGGGTAMAQVMTAIGALETGMCSAVVCVLASDEGTRHDLRASIHRPASTAGAYGMFTPGAIHAMMFRRHMHDYGTTPEQLGMIAVTQRAYANKRPDAIMHSRTMTIDDYMDSPSVVEPLRRFDYCLISDHGVAFIVTSAERARDLKAQPVHISGVGLSHQLKLSPKEQYSMLDITEAKEQAFSMAGITMRDIDVAQLYDCWTVTVLYELEGYGFCERGEGGAYAADGKLGPDGPIPVNTQGGGLSWTHARGHTQISEAVRQLRGEAGATQVKDAEVALCAGHGGDTSYYDQTPCYQHLTVVLQK